MFKRQDDKKIIKALEQQVELQGKVLDKLIGCMMNLTTMSSTMHQRLNNLSDALGSNVEATRALAKLVEENALTHAKYIGEIAEVVDSINHNLTGDSLTPDPIK